MSSSPRVSIDADADAIGDDVARLPIDASVVVPSDASSSSARRERERERERDDDADGTHRDDGRARLLAVPIASSSAFVGVPLCEDDEDDDGRHETLETYTVNDALDRVGFGKFQMATAAFVGLAWSADAMEMMLLSFIGPSMRCEFGVSSREEGAMTSVVFAGMMLGAPSWGVMSDSRGRRPAMLASAATTLAAGVGSGLGGTFGWVMFFRFIVGIGLGGVPVAYGLFMEFLPSENRGVHLTLIELFWTLGSMIESALAWIILPRHSWRMLLLVSTVPLFFLIACILVAPESALYLVNAGRVEEAEATLRRVAAINGKSLPPGSLAPTRTVRSVEFEEHTTYSDGSSRGRSSGGFVDKYVPTGIRRLLSKKHAKTSALVWIIFFGVAFLYYGIVLLTTSLNVRDDENASGEVTCLPHGAPALERRRVRRHFRQRLGEVPGLLVAVAIVDRIGRRGSMALTLAMTAVCLFPVAFETLNTTLRDVALFVGRSSAMAAFTVLYIFAGEVYPTSIRSTGVGVGNGFARIGGITCPAFAVALIESGHVTLSVVFFVAVAAAPPPPRSRSPSKPPVAPWTPTTTPTPPSSSPPSPRDVITQFVFLVARRRVETLRIASFDPSLGASSLASTERPHSTPRRPSPRVETIRIERGPNARVISRSRVERRASRPAHHRVVVVVGVGLAVGRSVGLARDAVSRSRRETRLSVASARVGTSPRRRREFSGSRASWAKEKCSTSTSRISTREDPAREWQRADRLKCASCFR